jgi:YidC/Oxa1 family membrane protein insertase
MYSFPPLAAAIGLLYTAVTGLATALAPLLGVTSAAVAIVAMTVIIRLALVPLGWRQVLAERQRQRLAPKLGDLHRKYRGNPERLRRELAALYAKEGASPLAGCLPVLAQAPVFMVLYGLFLTAEVGGQANVLLTSTIAGAPLGARLLDVGFGTDLLVFAVLIALLVVAAWATRRFLMPPTQAGPEVTSTPTGGPPRATGGADDGLPGAGIQAQVARVARLLPFGTVVIAAIVPLAAGLYLLTTTAWTVAERVTLRRIAARRA